MSFCVPPIDVLHEVTKDAEWKRINSHAQKDHLFLLLKVASGMIYAFYKADPGGKIRFLAYKTLFWFKHEKSVKDKTTYNASDRW